MKALAQSQHFPQSRHIQPQHSQLSRRRFVLMAMSMVVVAKSRIVLADDDEFAKTIHLGEEVCDYFGLDSAEMPGTVHTFRSSRDAEDAIKDITNSIGLTPRFRVLAAGVPNAAAIIKNNTRYILYSRTFMRDMERRTGTAAAGVSILAHEVGHHLNAHTLEQGGSRPNIELEADRFSGNVMRKLGYSLDDAQAAMKKLGSNRGSSTHPGKRDRLEAIAEGYEECERDNSCPNSNDAGRDNSSASNRRDRNPKPKPGPDSCQYAHDGECDEPELCDRGTDTSDCSVRQQPRRQQPSRQPPAQPRPASACCNPYTGQPVCPMRVPLPQGVPCHCGGIPGSGVTCY